MKLKNLVWRVLGKDPEAVVVSFAAGPEALVRRMLEEVTMLVPDREHYAVTEFQIDGVCCVPPGELPGPLRRKRIGLAPTLFSSDNSLVWTALRMAPFKILAYNNRLERHHLRLSTLIASILFVRGVPLDRIFLRPSWLFPFKRDRSRWPDEHWSFEGRPSQGRPRVGILSPYLPFPLSHGGAVRMFNLIREAARDFDVFLFAFCETPSAAPPPLLDLCEKVVLFANPRYREPRWSTLLPPEVREFRSDYVAAVVEQYRREFELRLLQVEFTQLASFKGDVLVEHDVTFDLYRQLNLRERTWSSWWTWWRWHRYERRVVRRYPRVITMSEEDAGLLTNASNVRVIPNGVDLQRFHPEPEPPGSHLLFVGSFRHFPNVMAYRFFLEQIWPQLAARNSDVRLTVVAGPDPHLYHSAPATDSRIEVHGFVSDVPGFYAASNIVIVPTQVSAGTNLKVLEAMASARAIVSTPSGCAGLGLVNGESVWIADNPEDFAEAVLTLLADPSRRGQMGWAAGQHAERQFSWTRLGRIQKRVWTELLTGVTVRKGSKSDLPAITRIQDQSHSASQWEPPSYFDFEVRVAEKDREVRGFLVSREIDGEIEVLNLAVDLRWRRTGVATMLLESIAADVLLLEVRESNHIARNLYSKLGFRIVGRRCEYYDNPVESALVMRLSRLGESDTF